MTRWASAVVYDGDRPIHPIDDFAGVLARQPSGIAIVAVQRHPRVKGQWLQQAHAWPGLAAVGMVEAERCIRTARSVERRYYLLSTPLPASMRAVEPSRVIKLDAKVFHTLAAMAPYPLARGLRRRRPRVLLP